MALLTPLADLLRPQSLGEVVGQTHLLGEGKVLHSLNKNGHLPNLIFYGPSGVGKTTVAKILAKSAGKKLHYLNGTTAGTADIKDVLKDTLSIDGIGGIVLYLDEIQYFNKKQQQTLLEYLENGSVTMIASTTENPHFYVYSAVLSRCTVLEFKPLAANEVSTAIERAFDKVREFYGIQFSLEDNVVQSIAHSCGGDVRKALNAVELLSAWISDEHSIISEEMVREIMSRSANRYDRDGDEHYNILSALQKSVRGSDENAALHYLARLLDSGDLISPCRRLLVMASEDIGLAYPQAVSIVKSCIDSARELGLPEARIPLAQAVILMCTAPKSNSVITAIDTALSDVRSGNFSDIPPHLKDAHYKGAGKLGRGVDYLYPHSYPNNYVKQEYLPEKIKDRIYYNFGENKAERAAKLYRDIITGKHDTTDKK